MMSGVQIQQHNQQQQQQQQQIQQQQLQQQASGPLGSIDDQDHRNLVGVYPTVSIIIR